MQIHVHLSQPGVCLSAWSSLSSFPVTDAVCVSPAPQQQQQQGKSVACSFATGAPSIIWSVSLASLSANVAVTFTEAPFLLAFRLLFNGDCGYCLVSFNHIETRVCVCGVTGRGEFTNALKPRQACYCGEVIDHASQWTGSRVSASAKNKWIPG